jgi:hypothetical protein
VDLITIFKTAFLSMLGIVFWRILIIRQYARNFVLKDFGDQVD